ncbi:Peptidase S10, serine carboxypeptidase [Cynara cardunculus var. scolymus]|uniref:Peptidase S10, serine carboxypeptidase n=1 Tax=Cynara cardunculus var. scolymus TaxID=59895 RepID=A0A103XZ81_CYNCS|nr:Peptidase S10, serine carboxypeptidase [Cynara cardunculus var. scolymus]
MDQLFLVIVVILYFRVAISTLAGRVEYLPGFQGPLPFHLETGYRLIPPLYMCTYFCSYIGVDENEDVQLFYYFIQSESNPRDDPLMLWISGGPGCSSITGLLYSIVNYNESLPTLILRPNSWTKMASIIFLDIPVGTGFSYATTTRATHSNDLQLAKHAYEFMRKWLKSHPGFVSNPFYIGGDSYSGIPIPAIAQLISNGNDVGNEPRINMKGYVLGNPRTFPNENNFDIRFANEYISVNNVACRKNLESYEQGSIGHWVRCSSDLRFTKILEDVRPYHQNLSKKDLNYTVTDRWRSWKLRGQIAGSM